MFRPVKYLLAALLLMVIAGFVYGGIGYADALADAESLARRADALIADGRGGDGLGKDRLTQLLMVQDPAFRDHAGVDLTTAGAGLTTVTQSLAKRVGFETFKPGIGKIRQTGYALGLEQRLSKDHIMALWLDTLEMGSGPDGWMKGFYTASESVYGKPPTELSDRQFLSLVAVLIAPSRYDLLQEDPQLEDRVARIERLITGGCVPESQGDVWLEGCRVD